MEKGTGCPSPWTIWTVHVHQAQGAGPRSAAEVMSPWKHEHPGPHLSRSRRCPCNRKKRFLALVFSQGSPAGYPVSGPAGHPVGPPGVLEPRGGRAWQSPRCGPWKPRLSDQLGDRAGAHTTEDNLSKCSPGVQRRRLCHRVTDLALPPILPLFQCVRGCPAVYSAVVFSMFRCGQPSPLLMLEHFYPSHSFFFIF